METKLKWHYFKDEIPNRFKDCLVLIGKDHLAYREGSIKLAKFFREQTDEEILNYYQNDMWAYIEVPKIKEFHVWLDRLGIPDIETSVYITNIGTKYALEVEESIIHTTQTSFLRTSILDDYRLFVHKGGKQIEITLGECQGTDRIIKVGDNLEKLVLGGEFSFD